MKSTSLLLTTLAILLVQVSFSQPICGFDGVHQKRLNADAEYRKTVVANEARLQEIIKVQEAARASGQNKGLRPSTVQSALYTIPVVVHVVHTGGAIGTIYNPTDVQITNTINYLNQVYNGTYPGTTGAGDLQIQFALATRDPNCNATTGIDRVNGSAIPGYAAAGVNYSTSGGATELSVKDATRWDPASYYNIWVISMIDGKDGTSGQFIAGYAYLAGGSPAYDGTIMLATQMAPGAKTLPHEIGHALSLYHPFEGSANATSCPANSNCNTDGDKVCDTDPITYNQTGGIVDFTCRSGTNTCTGTAYTSLTESNYMNYTSCYNQFTNGQKARMLAAMSIWDRVTLVNSWGTTSAYPASPYTAPVSTCSSTTGAAGLAGNVAGILTVSLNNKNYFTGATADDGGYVNQTSSCLNLIPLNINGTYTFSGVLLGGNNEQLRAWIDYNNDGVFNNATEQVIYATNVAPVGGGNYPQVSTSFTVPPGAVTGTVLRLRVMDEVSAIAYGAGYTITGSCYNPVYGQAEDYPVLLSASALPVHFESFKGDLLNNDIRLSWKTNLEENTSAFVVERSYDGNVYDSIGMVKATGIPTGASYSFDDITYNGAVMYYRLKEADKDGRYQYSGIVIIKSNSMQEATVSILTNPFRERFEVTVNTPAQSTVRINLLDATGKLVYTTMQNVLNRAVIAVAPGANNLSAGVYFAQVVIGGKTITKKLIKE